MLLAALALTGCPADDEVEPTADAGPAPIELSFGSPSPAQGAADVDPGGITLEFGSAPTADSYRVFLGTDYPAVQGRADGVALGEAEGEIETGTLEKGALYFWRVEATLEGESSRARSTASRPRWVRARRPRSTRCRPTAPRTSPPTPA